MIFEVPANFKGWLIEPVWAQAPTQWTDPTGGQPAELKDLEYVFSRALGAVLALGGLIAFIYILISGFKYITAGEDEKAVGDAKKALTYSFIGLLVVIAAWLILNTLGQILSIDLLQFEIPK